MNPGAVARDAFVDARWIAERRADETICTIEVDVSATAYRDGHIPEAAFWNIYSDLRGPGYAPIDRAGLEALLTRSGLTPETTAVFYGYGAHLGYWLLKRHGHDRVRLLDGPRQCWSDAGYEWAREEPEAAAAAYSLGTGDPALEASRQEVLALLGQPGPAIVDVRSRAEYDGERFWPSGAIEGAGRAGHIPGSIHVPIELFRDEDGLFADPGELARLLLDRGITPAHPVVTYCTIGNRASQAWFALHRLGYEHARVYHGSWAEWGTLPGLPIDRAASGQ